MNAIQLPLEPMDRENCPEQYLFELQPAYSGIRYVIVSTTFVFGTPETYVFEANQNGDILEFTEIGGSFKWPWATKYPTGPRPATEQALQNMGYTCTWTDNDVLRAVVA